MAELSGHRQKKQCCPLNSGEWDIINIILISKYILGEMVENFMSVCSFVLLFLFIVGFIGLFVFTFRTAVLSNPIFEYSIGLKKSQYSPDHGT